MKKILWLVCAAVITSPFASEAQPKRRTTAKDKPVAAFTLEAGQCLQASDLIARLQNDTLAALTSGDLAAAQVTAFESTETISMEDSNILYLRTKAMENNLEESLKTLQALDALFPIEKKAVIQAIHIKLATSLTSVRPYALKTIRAMLKTLDCEMDESEAICQTQALAPAFGKLFSDFKPQVTSEVTDLREFFSKLGCSEQLKNIAVFPPAAVVVTPELPKE